MRRFKMIPKIVLVVVMIGISCLVLNGGRVFADDDGLVGDYVSAENVTVLPEIYIKAINPGYTIDGISNVGEMIELARNSNEMVSLAGTAIGYINSSGNFSLLWEFPENSWIAGETILLRLASSPEHELAAVNYTKTLAFKAGIVLKRGEEVIDEVYWTGKDGNYKEFQSAHPTVLVRNLETGLFKHEENYEPIYDEKSYLVEEKDEKEEEAVEMKSQCKGVLFSEILSYYENSKMEQFIELYNSGSEQVLLDGCKIRYKNKDYELSGIVKAEEYYVFYLMGQFSLTKNPTNYNRVELVDANDEILDRLDYPNGQRKGTAYALIGYDKIGKEIWRTTYALTPGAPNVFQEFKSCEEGKVINEETGNCVKVANIATAKICPEGQYLNILTGRCKKYEVKTSAKTCKEGYYLNEETGRCRKIVENKGADYSLEPEEYEEKSSFVALYAVIGIVLAGVSYLVYEFRKEIKSGIMKLLWKGKRDK